MEDATYTLKKAQVNISNMDLKQDCAGIGCYTMKQMMKNCNVDNIVCLKQQNVSPALYAELQCCQPTTSAVECSLSTFGKLLCKERQFVLGNVKKYLSWYYNKLYDVKDYLYVKILSKKTLFSVKICQNFYISKSKIYSFLVQKKCPTDESHFNYITLI